ncbi:unnamed protein product, partial [Anisakis simplex]|uniref:A2M domain-containing protein n=1 Tax=Anisakis simplex TaxID=6269 RepID=A0A0M3JZT9_ANISI
MLMLVRHRMRFDPNMHHVVDFIAICCYSNLRMYISPFERNDKHNNPHFSALQRLATTLLCDQIRSDLAKAIIEIRIAEFVNGFWSEEVNVSGCWMIDDKQAFTVIAEIREWGAGKRGEGRADADPQSANFELIPLRPGFKTKSAQPVLILVRAFSGDVSTRRGLVEIETTCICKDRRKTQTSIVSRVNIGDILSLSLDDDFVCRALRIQAFRKIGSRISRKVTLILPSFDNSPAINFDWISTSLPHSATFNVGDKFRAFVPIDSASKLNYLVVCNKASIATAGRARDDGLIIFEINSNMIEYCVLYVFNIDEDVRTDMILFFVRQQCPYSISVSTNKIVPSETINITLKGGSNGLATLSAIDARMLRLFETLSSTTVVHYWDLSFFNKPELKDDQIRLINFLDPKSLIDSFTSAACDRNVQSCELIKLAGMPYVARISTKPPLLQYGGVMNDAGIMRGLKKPSIRIRELFPEVWLFDDFILGRSGRKTVQLNSPDSVTQWAISSSFWSVGDMDTCSPVSPTVTSSKDTFIAVEVPNHVYVNETITARVTVVAENIDEHKL